MMLCYSVEGYVKYINGEVCLKTGLEFPNKCSFQVNTTQDYFKTDRGTCRSKCSVKIYSYDGYMFSSYHHYSLRTITVISGNRSTTINTTCSTYSGSDLRINCSSWKHDVFLVGNEHTCQERDAECAHIEENCICHCLSGYIMVNGRCLLANVHVGDMCSSDLQCTGTDNSGVCCNGVCQCQLGYLKIDGFCYQEGLFLNQPCAHNLQCSVSPHAACLEGRCSCIGGYKARSDGQCEKEKASYGGFCSQNDQCTNSTACTNERCTCKQGFVFIDTGCHKQDVLLNQSCVYSHQCLVSPYAACLEGRCSCIDGYKARNNGQCEKEKASNGGLSSQNDQCTNSTVCKNERCTCKQGFVFIDTDCHKKDVLLNQSCIYSHQCTESPYAACLKGRCSCIDGYKSRKGGQCEKDAQGSTSVNISILGVLYGGFFLSGFITAGLVLIIYRRFKSSEIKRPLPCISFKEVYSLSRAAEFNRSRSSSPQNTMNNYRTFQQGNNRLHTARIKTAFLQRNNINVLSWPSKSQDLNHLG
uniref:Prion-like-(Q/N-rich) domain-bearing protein 25 n=1 Tax=Crassostrea virginica TaxID=6565 RepID=A0A8B8BDQ6_CRAVI|nr:prion-like-(Q/N-rich) domain-bearing protein 25 [Crassostrea virginica]